MVRERRRAKSLAALVALLTAIGPMWPLVPPEVARYIPIGPAVAEARIDPLRVVTAQIVRPNILVVLDTSGSMSFRPDYDTSAGNVGGDCYQGDNCTATVQANLCADGITSCSAPNTCINGVTSCSAGVNIYCDNGAPCTQDVRTVGSGSTKTLCTATAATCRDNSPCRSVCTAPIGGTAAPVFCDGIGGAPSSCDSAARRCDRVCRFGTGALAGSTPTVCTSSTQCASLGDTCQPAATCALGVGSCSAGAGQECTGGLFCTNSFGGTNGTRRCRTTATGTQLSSTSCTSASQCDTIVANPCARRCANAPGTTCTSNAQCAAATCPTLGTTTNNGFCANQPTLVCDNNNDCPTNSCSATANRCPNAGNPNCDFWQNAGTPTAVQCNGPEDICTGPTGNILGCGFPCPGGTAGGGGTCYASAHCGSAGCTSGLYQGSSRLAIAKHVLSNLVSNTSELVNYGFSTFGQVGYFPYITNLLGTTTSETHVQYWDDDDLDNAGGWNNGPMNTFTSGGIVYRLYGTGAPSPAIPAGETKTGNSQYRRGSQGNRIYLDLNWCGSTSCQSGGNTWSYRGSYYWYTETITTGGTQTLLANPTFAGSNMSLAGVNYSYFDFPTDYWGDSCSSGTTCLAAPVVGQICGGSGCGSSCTTSSRSHGQVLVQVPTSSTPASRDAAASLIQDRLKPQSLGGVVAHGGTPTGCSLQYASSGTAGGTVGSDRDAYSNLAPVRAADAVSTPCRKTFVLLVTDGDPQGPGESGCSSATCSNPASLGGCTCKSVLATSNLYTQLNVKTYAVGFGFLTGTLSDTMENIAKAGRSCRAGVTRCSFSATNEDELTNALYDAVFDAIKGDYATSAPTVATSTGSTTLGDVSLIASTEFPLWRGHLRAISTAGGGTPTTLWDAGERLNTRVWNTRRMYTAAVGSTTLVPLFNNGVANGSGVYITGLGASPTDANDLIARIAGQGAAWKLGPILNSTAVTIGSSIDYLDSQFPGHDAFVTATHGRPRMVYVGSDSGMIHAFFLENGSASGVTWSAGDEAWAFVPPALFTSVTRVATQGQPPNPSRHVYGVASSPKVNDVCSSPCASGSDWHTILISGLGLGSNAYYGFDITGNPAAGSQATAPFTLRWRTDMGSTFTGKVGYSYAVPAFLFANDLSGNLKSLVTFGSGYQKNVGMTGEGKYIFVLDAWTGVPFLTPFLTTAPASPSTTYAVVADGSVAMSNGRAVAIYQADAAGRIWRFNNGNTLPASAMYDSGATHPFLYSPAVLVDPAVPNQVLVAAVDSAFYDDELNDGVSDPTPAVHLMLDVAGSVSGRTTLLPVTNICKSGCTHGVCSGCPKLSANARPVGSPIILKNGDTTATSLYQILVNFYEPGTATCDLGASYLVVIDANIQGVGASATLALAQSEARGAGTGVSSGLIITSGGMVVGGNTGYGAGGVSSVTVVSGNSVNWAAQSGGSSGPPRVNGMAEVP